ncbi:MAG: AMIN domain-containing protein, partial [Cyanobacteria bacterium P01_F01_bin.86]
MVTIRVLTALPWAGVISLAGGGLPLLSEATAAMSGDRTAIADPNSKTQELKSRSQNQPTTTWIAQGVTSPVQITDVQIQTTEAGLQVVLATTARELATPTTMASGNALIIEIPNAVLSLPEGDTFQQFEPAVGIALIAATNLPDNRMQLVITGTEALPLVDINTAAPGWILSITPDSEVDAAAIANDTLQVIV